MAPVGAVRSIVIQELIQLHLVETDTGSGSWHSPVVANLPTSRWVRIRFFG